MRAFRRLLALAGVMSLVVIPTSLPAFAQSGAPSSITHRQSVLTELSPTGEPGTSRIFTQLSVEGDGDVQVVLPNQSTSGLRNLDGFGRPSTSGDDVVWDIAATPDGVHRRTVADSTADQPVSIDVAYEFDGESIAPKDLLGRSGVVTVTYTVRNLTSVPQEIRSFDGQGRPSVETLDVAVPMVGSLSTTLDSRFVDVQAPGAAVAGDGRGNTVVNWSLLLFAPLGSEEAVLSYTADVSDAVVAPATAQILPVDSRSFNSLRSAQDSFKSVNSGLKDLTNGALIVDGNVKLLAGGAAQLLDGLEQLRDGAEALNEGLAGSAAPGAQQLSDGLGQASSGGRELANGLGDLESGARQIANGMGSASAGGGELASGLGDLESGASALSAGLGSARSGAGDLNAGLGQLQGGADQIAAGLTSARGGSEQITAGLAALAQGLNGAAEGTAALAQLSAGLEASFLGSPAALDEAIAGLGGVAGVLAIGLNVPEISDALVPPALSGLPVPVPYSTFLNNASAGVGQISAGLQGNKAALGTSPPSCQAALGILATTPPTELKGLEVMRALTCISSQVDTGIRVGSGSTPSAVDAAGQLAAGSDGLTEGLRALETGSIGLAAGAGSAADGSAALAGGLVQLDDGAKQLADGAGRAASGSADLADGLRQLDDGAGQLADGAGRAASGSNDLANGLVQLDDGAEQLAAGLGDAADGSGQIAEGLGSAADGGEKIADGTVRLSEAGMGSIIDGASAGAAGPSQLFELAKAVDSRGRAGEGLPYGTPDGAVASAVFRYEIAGVGSDEGPGIPGRLTAALLGLAAAGSLAFVGMRRRGI